MGKEFLAYKSLSGLADEFNYSLEVKEHRVSFQDSRACITLNLEFTTESREEIFLYVYVRTTSWDLPGERTDANEFMSTMLGVYLRLEIGVSCSIWDIPHPAGEMLETEIYARYLVANQPFSSKYELNESGVGEIRNVLSIIRKFELEMPMLFEWTTQKINGEYKVTQDYGWVELADWARNIANTINEPWSERELPVEFAESLPSDAIGPIAENIQYNWRQNPNWKHYRSIASGVTLYEMPRFAKLLQSRISEKHPWEELDGPLCKLFLTTNTCNAVAHVDLEIARKVLEQLSSKDDRDSVVCIPLEHDVIAASSQYLLFLRRDTSRKRFESERESIRKRHQRESTLLFPILTFEWGEQIDDQQFEMMILELVKREPGVQRARIVSASSEPDGGRDILCEWRTPPTLDETVEDGKSPSVLRKVIIQCKAYKRSVNKSNVQDIRDTVEHYNASGYFLAVSSHLTTPLTDHLDGLRQRGQIWVDWWTRSEIEERLVQHQDVALKYPDIVRCH